MYQIRLPSLRMSVCTCLSGKSRSQGPFCRQSGGCHTRPIWILGFVWLLFGYWQGFRLVTGVFIWSLRWSSLWVWSKVCTR